MRQPLSDFIAENYTRVDRKTVLNRLNEGQIPGYRAIKEGKRWYVVRDTWARRALEYAKTA